MPKTYGELVALHVPRPIADKVTYENTVEIVDALPGHSLNADPEDYLEILSEMVAAYEDEHLPALPKASPLELLKFLLDENELTGDDLAEILGVDRSVAYKILKGRRNLTAEHIRKLAQRFAVRADLFL